MKLYYVSLTFHYTKKKKYEKFRGPLRPLLNPPLWNIKIYRRNF